MIKKTITYISLSLAAFISLFPFYFMFISATNSNSQILNSPPSLFFGSNLIANFITLNERINIARVLFNSLFAATSFVMLSLLFFSMAGYAFAKYDFRFKKFLFSIILLSMMLPPEVLYVPMFKLMILLGWTDSYKALIFPPLANAFGIFLMRQNMLGFPNSVIEAARIDGVGEIGIFFKVIIPNMKSAIAALGIYMFMANWNSFMWPLIVLGTDEMYTFPVALSVLDGMPNKKDYGMMMLGASLAVIPIIAIYLSFQKHFINNVLGGAVKE